MTSKRVKELEQRVAELEAEVDGYDRLIWRQGEILTDAVNVLKGPPPELTTWSTHDVAELARDSVKRQKEASERALKTSHVILLGAAYHGCNWATDGSISSYQRIYNETIRLVTEKAWQEGYDQGVHDGIDSYEQSVAAARLNPYRMQ